MPEDAKVTNKSCDMRECGLCSGSRCRKCYRGMRVDRGVFMPSFPRCPVSPRPASDMYAYPPPPRAMVGEWPRLHPVTIPNIKPWTPVGGQRYGWHVFIDDGLGRIR